MTIIKTKLLFEIIELLVLDKNTWNHITVCKWFLYNRNTWYLITAYYLF